MLTEERIKELEEKLLWIYFVGIGYWSDVETFALGVDPDPNMFKLDVFSSKVLDTEISRMSPYAPEGWKLIFFMVVRDNKRVRITKEEAIWILDNRPKF